MRSCRLLLSYGSPRVSLPSADCPSLSREPLKCSRVAVMALHRATPAQNRATGHSPRVMCTIAPSDTTRLACTSERFSEQLGRGHRSSRAGARTEHSSLPPARGLARTAYWEKGELQLICQPAEADAGALGGSGYRLASGFRARMTVSYPVYLPLVVRGAE